MSNEAANIVSTDAIETFSRDGVVRLPEVLDQNWLVQLRDVIDSELAERTQKQFVFGEEKSKRFLGSQDMWRTNDVCRRFCTASVLPSLAAGLLGARSINLFFDHLFVKEPGGKIATSWHNDGPYWPVKGNQIVSIWVALDDVTEESGALTFALGSHEWDFPLQPPTFAAQDFEKSPQDDLIDRLAGSPLKLSEIKTQLFEVSAGDVIVFHSNAIHCAGANKSPDRIRRGYVIRYTGDDVVYDPRPGVHKMMLEKSLATGGPIECERYPVVWRR